MPIRAHSVKSPGRTILIIDDEADIRVLLARVLTGEGYPVLTAQNGQEGMVLVRAHLHLLGAVLVDALMPQLNGQQTLQAVRVLAPTLPVVLMSGAIVTTPVLRGACDFDHVIAKPFLIADLVAIFQHLLPPPLSVA